MAWKITPAIEEILRKGRDGVGLERDEALALVHLELESRETYALMESANHLSRGQFGRKGERHFHIGLNVEPCPMDCLFCSLTRNATDCPSQALRKKKSENSRFIVYEQRRLQACHCTHWPAPVPGHRLKTRTETSI